MPATSPIVPLRSRRLDELNPVLVKRKPQWAQGVLDAANMLDSMFSRSSTHPYSLGDCLLSKVNLLASRCRVRKNPYLNTK